MRYIIALFLTILNISPVLSICEGVNLESLKEKLENVVADAELGKEAEKFNTDIVGADRLCTVKISQAANEGKELSPEQEAINELYDMIGWKSK